MTAEKLIETIAESNQQLMPYFVKYCKQMLENSDETYWEQDSLEEAKFIFLSYFQEDYELYFHYLDADIDEIYQNETYSFTEFLEGQELKEPYRGFLPESLIENDQDALNEHTMEVEQLMAETFKAVFAELGEDQVKLPVVFKEEDSERFIDVSTGETYDHVELKTYAFGKRSTEELLSMMKDKLEEAQGYFSNFIDFILANENHSIWPEENVRNGKAALIRAEYDSGRIHLDLLDEAGETLQKEADWSYPEYMEEKHSFVYRRLGIYFPFEVYDYVNCDREEEIAPFKVEMNQWLTESIGKSSFSDKKQLYFIQERFEKNYWNPENNQIINREELVLMLH